MVPVLGVEDLKLATCLAILSVLLISMLEQEFGAEDHQLQIDASAQWQKLFRPRGQSVQALHVVFDYYLEEANSKVFPLLTADDGGCGEV